MDVEIRQANYRDPGDAAVLVALLDGYASDPLGGGTPLPAEVRVMLPERLAAFPTALSLLAFADGEPAGLANAVLGFSTFAARPLLNLHDLVVAVDYRGKGIGRRLLERLETVAHERGCCKMTLEVLTGNATAQGLYQRCGYAPDAPVHPARNPDPFRAFPRGHGKARSAGNGRSFPRIAKQPWPRGSAPDGRVRKRPSSALCLLEREPPFPARQALG